MKRILTALMALLVVMSFAVALIACDTGIDTGDDNKPPVTDKDGNTVVSIMVHVDRQSAEGKAYQKRVDAFNVAHAEKKIKATITFKARTTGATSYETELNTMRMEGTLPDIITFDAPNCASYAYNELLADISSLIPGDVQSDFYSLNTYNGKLYGLPIQESSAGFYYNKKLFAAAGIDVSAYTVENPWTFDQFKEVCAKLKNYLGNGKAVDMRLDATKDETATYLLYPFIYAAGGSFTSADGFTADGYLNSTASKNGFRFLRDLVDAGYTSNAIGATDFFTGKVGMYLSSGWTIPDLDNKYRDTFASRDDWGLLPYPKGTTAASATGSWSFGITNNGKADKSPAAELLLWMTSVESSKAITDATGMIPARKSVETNYQVGDPEYTLMKQLELSGVARPATVAYPNFSTAFSQIIYQISTGSVDDFMRTIDAQTSSLQREMNSKK